MDPAEPDSATFLIPDAIHGSQASLEEAHGNGELEESTFIAAKVAIYIRRQGRPPGWRAEVHIEERIKKVCQLYDLLL
jgi:hypothetical protein